MGQYSGFIIRLASLEEFNKVVDNISKHNSEFTQYPELLLIVGIIKGDSDGAAKLSLILSGAEDFCILGQFNSLGDDFISVLHT